MRNSSVRPRGVCRQFVGANWFGFAPASSRRATSSASPTQQALWRSCHLIEVSVSLGVHHSPHILPDAEVFTTADSVAVLPPGATVSSPYRATPLSRSVSFPQQRYTMAQGGTNAGSP